MKDIFEGTPMHEYYLELARAEVLQERIQSGCKLLLTVVQACFPTLTRLAETQVSQIEDLAIMYEVMSKVSAAQTIEEVEDALLSRLPDDDSEK